MDRFETNLIPIREDTGIKADGNIAGIQLEVSGKHEIIGHDLPAGWLMHHVHDFKSDVERISVSGNIMIEVITK